MTHALSLVRVSLPIALALLLLAGRPTQPASAVTFTVDTTEDVLDPNDGKTSLREAIIAANASPGADTITLPAGAYTRTIAGSLEDAAATGDLDVTGDLTITGAGAPDTVIDGGGLDRVLDIIGDQGVDLQMNGLTVRGGNAPSELGGGIFAGSAATLTLRSAVITANTAGSGGGISKTGDSTLIAENSTITDNHAVSPGGDLGGGGILNGAGGGMTLTNTTVSHNTSAAHGGAIWTFGGAILTNVTLSANQAAVDGGGIYKGAAFPLLNNVTITANTADSDSNGSGAGGGIFAVQAGITARNTIVALNTAGDCAGPVGSLGHNLDSDGACGFAGPGDLPNTNPLLGPLADNGGPTMTHALLPGSPAIDTGDNAGCAATDQRGAPRPSGSACDIGAFESGAVPPAQRLWGDLDCNDLVKPADSTAVLQHDAGSTPSPKAGCPKIGDTVELAGASPHLWGDLDCNGLVKPADSTQVLQHDAGQTHDPKAGCPKIGSTVATTP